MLNAISQLAPQCHFQFPFYSSSVPAGFPSPADDYIESNLDLNALLIKHPTATFFVRVSGDSMINAGIHDQDILIVDRSLEPTNGRIVIAAVDGQLTVKRLKKTPQGKVYLMPENEAFAPIEVKPEAEVYIWGIVTNVIHPVS